MKTIRLFGASLLILAGYLLHMALTAQLHRPQLMLVTAIICACLYLGISAMIMEEKESFGEYIFNAFFWFLP